MEDWLRKSTTAQAMWDLSNRKKTASILVFFLKAKKGLVLFGEKGEMNKECVQQERGKEKKIKDRSKKI